MGNKVENAIDSYFPRYMALKLNSRIDQCEEIVKRYEAGGTLSNRDEKVLLGVLKYTGNL